MTIGSDRTHPIILDHLDGILAALNVPPLPFVVEEWFRPQDTGRKFEDPPFALVRIFPSTGQLEGPIADSQADIILRFQILGVGHSQRQAINVTDLCRPRMQRRLIPIPARRVQDVRYMVVSGGISRDDDLPTPFFYNMDLYELLTTPA